MKVGIMEPSKEAIEAALLKWYGCDTIEQTGPGETGGSWSDPFIVRSFEEMRAALAAAYAIDNKAEPKQ
jgi:hypothetical protein